mgnify:CR=1 FL=1
MSEGEQAQESGRDRSGAESLVQTFVDSGVNVCFANPGTSEMHFVAALDTNPDMRCVLGLFEGIVTGCADGYGRMIRKPAVTLTHLGPGLGNGIANLHNAKKARTPIVNVVGDHATYHRKYDAPLTSDVEGVARPVSGWVKVSQSADDVAADGAEAEEAHRCLLVARCGGWRTECETAAGASVISDGFSIAQLDADGDGVVDGATYDAWTGRFTIPTQNIGTALSNYFYTMVHTAYPDTTNLYPPTYFQYEWTNPGFEAGESRDLYMQYYLTVPGVAGGYDDMQWTFYAYVDREADYGRGEVKFTYVQQL